MKSKEKTFSGFSVRLQTGSKRKQRLSNHLTIQVDDDRTSVAQRLTLREARTLQKWLSDNLPQTDAEGV